MKRSRTPRKRIRGINATVTVFVRKRHRNAGSTVRPIQITMFFVLSRE
jgi:hypothetical protein